MRRGIRYVLQMVYIGIGLGTLMIMAPKRDNLPEDVIIVACWPVLLSAAFFVVLLEPAAEHEQFKTWDI